MTTATETPSRESDQVDTARESVRDATVAKEQASEAARSAAAAAKADPDNRQLADAAREARNARRRADRALKKAESALDSVQDAAAETPAEEQTEAPAGEQDPVAAAREALAEAERKKAELAAETVKADAAAEADPDNSDLFAAARKARWDQLKAGKAVQKANAALEKAIADAPTEDSGGEQAVEPAGKSAGTPAGEQDPVAAARAELARAEEEKEALAAATVKADAAAEADPDNSDLFAAARKARWDQLKAGKAVQKANAALEKAIADAPTEEPVEEQTAEAEAEAPVEDATPAEPADNGPLTVEQAEQRLAEAVAAVESAEAAAEADPDDRKLGAVARRARATQRKAARALKKARTAAVLAGDDSAGDDASAEGTAEDTTEEAVETQAEAAPVEPATPAPAATADTAAPVAVPVAAPLQDTLALVSSGASVLAVAADASERAAAADPGNALLAEAARAARAAAQQAAQAVAAAAALHGAAPVTASTTPAAPAAPAAAPQTTRPAATEEPAAEPAEAQAEEAQEEPSAESSEDPSVTAAREALAEAERKKEELAAETVRADAAAGADENNSDLFAAARKARWDELKAGKAVQKATAALEKAIADAPPAPKVLTEEEKEDRKAPKPQGQWLIDGHQTLNNDERIKQEDAGLAVADRVRNIYAKQGFDSIPAEDLAPRFKWIGMYTQRRQDMDGEQTGNLTNAELQDRYFMMRIRLDGGQVTPEQLRVIGGISSEFARGTADFTDRQNIQLHWIRIEDVPEIWDRLATVGLDTFFGCGDVPRVILGSPVAGISKDEIIDGTPAIREIKENLLTRDEFANLPRKFKSAISGNRRQDVTHEIQDLAFVGSEHPEKGPGFDVWVGGGLSTNPMLSQRLGVWVGRDEIPEVWAGVVRIFRDYGYRKLRNRARLKFLVADWGIEKFRRILEDDYLGHKLTDGPAPEIWPGYRDHVGVHEQKDGKFYVGVKPTVGHTEGDQLQRLADLAEAHGAHNIRTTPDKELIFLDIEPGDVDELTDALEKEGLSAKPSSFRRDIISCTGLEFCKLALVTTKQRAITLADQLEARLGDLDVPLKISLNGCPNSCARTQVADIGLKGQIVTDDDGKRVEGFQVHLGGALGMHPDWGKKLRGHKVTSAGLDDYVVRVVENYKANRHGVDEQFRDWVLRAPEEQLQ
jgi:sulfite reductase (ferredoxin)